MRAQGNKKDLKKMMSNLLIIFSSMQLNDPKRGFSFRHEGPLDMRMNNKIKSITAYDVINKLDEMALSRIIRLYGEDQRHRKIARCIHQWRSTFGPISTTTQLANIIKIGLGGR
jgi:16S rRNA (cytosine1402-N4)-methyltransferase